MHSTSVPYTYCLDALSIDISSFVNHTPYDKLHNPTPSDRFRFHAGHVNLRWYDNLHGIDDGASSMKSIEHGPGQNTITAPNDAEARPFRHKRPWKAFLPVAIQKLRNSNTGNSLPDEYEAQLVPQPAPLKPGSPPCSSDLPDLVQSGCSDPEESEDDGGDDEYLPSQDRKKCKQSLSPYSRLSTRKKSSPSPPPRPRRRIDKRTRSSPPSRNKQATANQLEEIRRSLRTDKSDNTDLTCPFPGCVYEQHNGRMPDFRRHIKTHIRKDGEVRCKGVPLQDALAFPHRFPNISLNEQPYAIPEEAGLWVGGCLKTFSRADALKRHLNHSITCEGYH